MTTGTIGAVSRRAIPAALVAVSGGCSPRSSWLAGAGAEAARVETLFWVLLVGGATVWAAVLALALWAARTKPADRREKEALARSLVWWGGLAIPSVVLTGLLVWSLLLMRVSAGEREGMLVAVEGEQWWWRVTYDPDTEAETVTANEIRLPLGKPVRFLLTSDDVIHSFWVPALGGKMDLVPGRTNELVLTPIREGAWTGFCAEYCGGAHAQMRFEVIVEDPARFAAWRNALSGPAEAPGHPGLTVFLENGCGACHTIRGTPAMGRVGPQLTHLAARTTLAAGVLPMTRAALARWIAEPDAVKPGVLMPPYPDIAPDDLSLLVDYLMALK